MIYRRLFSNLFLVLAGIFLSGGVGYSQTIILHLQNGDQLAGAILSENTNEVKFSTVWVKEILIPLKEIASREVVPQLPALTGPANGSAAAKATNAPQKNEGMALPLAGNLPTNTNGWWLRWKAEASVGLDMEKGATDHQLYYAKGKVTYTQPYVHDPKQVFNEILSYDYAYGKTDGTLSDDRMSGSSKTDFDLSRQMYIYNLGSAFYDQIRLIRLHYEDGPGVGYHWITRSNFLVNLELGFNYQAELRYDGTTNNLDANTYSIYGRLGQDLTWKINKQMNLTEKVEYFPRMGYATEFRFRFETILSYALMNHISLNFSVVDFYDTLPAVSVPNNDLQIRTSLGVKF